MYPSFWQIFIVLLIVLILFGPKRIPSMGRSLGEALRGFKKALHDDKDSDKSKETLVSKNSSEN